MINFDMVNRVRLQKKSISDQAGQKYALSVIQPARGPFLAKSNDFLYVSKITEIDTNLPKVIFFVKGDFLVTCLKSAKNDPSKQVFRLVHF